MNSQQPSKLEIISCFAIFYCIPFLDLLTGLLLHLRISSEGGIASPSQAGRILALGLMCFTFSKRQVQALCLALLYLLSIELISGTLLHQSTYGYSIGLVNANKAIFFISIAMFIFNYVKKTNNTVHVFEKITHFGLIYGVNVLVCLILGIGEKTYGGDSFGVKGFVPSNNGLSIVLGICALIALYLWRQHGYRPLTFIILSLSCLFVGAKTSMLLFGICMALSLATASKSIKITSTATIATASIIYAQELINIFSVIFDVIIIRFNIAAQNNDWATFFFSQRNNYVINAFQEFSTDSNGWWRAIIGSGAFASFRFAPGLMSNFYTEYDMLETDLFDIYFQYGLIFALAYIAFIYYGVLSSIKMKNTSILFIWLLISLFSILAGHVVFNGMSATLFASLGVLVHFNTSRGNNA